MSTGFDKALINQEKNRVQLAEALELKYSSERRNAHILRACCLIAAVFVARMAFRASIDISPVTQPSGQLIIAQMQKQMSQNDQLMIGSGNGQAPANRSRGEIASFVKEKVPLSLMAELRRGKLREGEAPGKDHYSERQSSLAKEIEELKKRKHAQAKNTSYGMYRPATPEENLTKENEDAGPGPLRAREAAARPPRRGYGSVSRYHRNDGYTLSASRINKSPSTGNRFRTDIIFKTHRAWRFGFAVTEDNAVLFTCRYAIRACWRGWRA